MDFIKATTFALLTVARQPVIYTRFLFNPGENAGNHIAEKK